MSKQKHSEKALEKFREGYNCAQSVLYAFMEDSIDEAVALNISVGFGAGMGKKQKVCGVISGAVMALGLKYGNEGNNNQEKTKNVYKKVQYLIERFTQEKGGINCIKLLKGCNLLTDEGQEYFQKNKLKETVCCEYVTLTCEIMEEIIDGKN